MSKTYRTRSGDSFSSISRIEFGSESHASVIAQMNPGIGSPIPPGTTVQLPVTGKSNRGFKPTGLDLRVSDTSIQTIDSITGTASLTGFRKFGFTIPNEVSTRLICKQFASVDVDIGYNGFPMLSGYLGASQPVKGEERKELSVSAYSNPNVISSPMMIDSFPLEFEKSDLDVISKQLLAPYSVVHKFIGNKGPVFSKIRIKQKQNTFEFLSNLSKQRALVIGDDGDGRLIYNDGMGYGEPMLVIDSESRPDCSVAVEYSPDDLFSHVTGILIGKKGRKRKKLTLTNPFYRGIIRPHEFEISESDEGELETAVRSVMARTFASAFRLTVTVPGWLDRFGNLIEPGVSISVRSPSDYIENFFDFLITDVTWSGTPSQKSTTMTGVIPGVFAGIVPEAVPWI
jgi:prophage tail gpP-like protein